MAAPTLSASSPPLSAASTPSTSTVAPGELVVKTYTGLPIELVADFLALYRESFAELEITAAGRQSHTDAEFIEEMANPAVLKFVAWVDGVAASMVFISNDLTTVPWISVPYYRHRFPDHYARQAIYYVGALLVHPGYRRGAALAAVLRVAAQVVAGNDGLAAFDCCEHNSTTVQLPRVVAMLLRRTCDVAEHKIDVQSYYALELRNPR